MLVTNQITKTSAGVPRVAVDQGEMLGFIVPADGSGGEPGTNWAHEFYHDMRHAAGFPCH
jgi:hypothetical protein